MALGAIDFARGESIRKPIPARKKLQRTAAIRKLGIGYIVAGIYPYVQSVSTPVIFNAAYDILFRVEPLGITGDDSQADFHFGQAEIWRAHGFAKTRGNRSSREGPTQKPTQEAGSQCLV